MTKIFTNFHARPRITNGFASHYRRQHKKLFTHCLDIWAPINWAAASEAERKHFNDLEATVESQPGQILVPVLNKLPDGSRVMQLTPLPSNDSVDVLAARINRIGRLEAEDATDADGFELQEGEADS